MTLACLNCKETNLQVCYPAWFKYTELYGDLNKDTFVDADAEARGQVFCPDCDTHFDEREYQHAADLAKKAAADGASTT